MIAQIIEKDGELTELLYEFTLSVDYAFNRNAIRLRRLVKRYRASKRHKCREECLYVQLPAEPLTVEIPKDVEQEAKKLFNEWINNLPIT